MTTRNNDTFPEQHLMFHYVFKCQSYYTRLAYDMAQRISWGYDPATGWSGVFMDELIAHRNWQIYGETYTKDDAMRDLKTMMASGYWEMEKSEDGSLWFHLVESEHQRMLDFDIAFMAGDYERFRRNMLTLNSPDRYTNQRKWHKKNKMNKKQRNLLNK